MTKKKIPPAEIFIINKPTYNKPPTPKEVEEWLIEFAKMHVTEALKKVKDGIRFDYYSLSEINKAINEAYPLENIN